MRDIRGIFVTLLWIIGCVSLQSQSEPWLQMAGAPNESEGKFISKADDFHFYNVGNFRTRFVCNGFELNTDLSGKAAFVMLSDTEGNIKWVEAFESSNDFKINFVSSNPTGTLFLLTEITGMSRYKGLLLTDSSASKEPMVLSINQEGTLLSAIKLKEAGKELKVKGFDVSQNRILLVNELKDSVRVDGQTFFKQQNESMLLLLLDYEGKIIKSKVLSTLFKIKPEAAIFNSDNGITLTGEFEGRVVLRDDMEMLGPSKSYYLIKWDENLDYVWHHADIVGPKGYKAKVLHEDSKGNILVAGEFELAVRINGSTLIQTIAIKKDLLLIKYNSAGTILWFDHVNPLEEVKPSSITTDKFDDIYLIGEYKKGFRYGYKNENPVVSTCENANNAKGSFIAKYSPNGTLKGAKSISGVNECKTSSIWVDFKNDIFITGDFKAQLAIDTLTIHQALSMNKMFYTARIDMHQCAYKYDNSQDFINKDIIFLHPNFPNPTTGSTFIHFHTARETDVNISIYDMTGRLVETVINTEKSEVRNYVLPYQFPEHLPGGVYLLVMTGNNQRLTKRIVLSR
jgi:hypothetical protein